MHHLHHHPIRSGVLAATMAMAIGLFGGAAAQAAVPCVVGPGVTQTDTTVTGSPGNDTIDCGGTNPAKTINANAGNDTITGTDFNDTINGGDGNDTITGGTGDDNLTGGLGGDTISGSAGNDTLAGYSNDGLQDSLDGGVGIDTCQGPAPDPDIHANCENTTMPPASGPGSSEANATDLCHAVGGTFVEVQPVGYNCLLIPGDHRVAEARRVCQGSGLVFVDVRTVLLVPGSYSCLL
jgi:hypothetical protein